VKTLRLRHCGNFLLKTDRARTVADHFRQPTEKLLESGLYPARFSALARAARGSGLGYAQRDNGIAIRRWLNYLTRAGKREPSKTNFEFNNPNARIGRCVVVSAKQYREFADECLGWAKTARSDRERRIFLQMAETWLEAAALAEQREKRQAEADKRQQRSDAAE
jgi:hypothetical protein